MAELINTRLGAVSGRYQHGVRVFRGVPYGESPTGPRRFRAPEPHGPWAGTLDASRFGPRAPQPEMPEMFRDPDAPKGQLSEDCLVLNIYTPACDGKHRPVLFWIHGGGFASGSGNHEDGSVLAAQGDVVVVTINYRLGILGFLDLSGLDGALTGAASNGIRDQVLALGWVGDNIADYGGDPDCVTIFGVSAGAGSVNAILAAPSADGLYHRAIAHSGAAVTTPPDQMTAALAAHLEVDQGDLLAHLRSASPRDLVAAQAESGLSFNVGLDGVVVTRDAYQAIADLGSRGVPYIAGSNRDEGTLFSSIMPSEAFDAEMAKLARLTFDGADPGEFLGALARAHPDDTAKDRFERVWNHIYRRAGVRACEAATEAGPGGWLYRFDFPTTGSGGALGASHGADVAFVFNQFAHANGPSSDRHDGDDPMVRALATAWSNTIVAFARTGDPNGAGLPHWPRYSSSTRQVMMLDAVPRIEQDPDAVMREIWAEALEAGRG